MDNCGRFVQDSRKISSSWNQAEKLQDAACNSRGNMYWLSRTFRTFSILIYKITESESQYTAENGRPMSAMAAMQGLNGIDGS